MTADGDEKAGPPGPEEPDMTAQAEKELEHVQSQVVSSSMVDRDHNEVSHDSSTSSERSGTAVPPVQKGPSQREKMPKSKIAIIMAALSMAVFLAALDMTIITTALPTIASHFHVSQAGYTWIGSAYLLANASSVPLWGKLSDIWGRKPIILVANVVFLVGSLVCALSVSAAMLIVGRAIQGVGGGGLIILVNICISDLFSMRSRSTYFGIVGMVWALASAVGPMLGGLFTLKASWRWCFYINLPCDGLAFIVLLIYLDIHTPKTPLLAGLKAIDWVGSITIVGGTVMFLLGLEFGGISYPWSSATVICLIIFGLVVLALFLVNEGKLARYPVMPLRLFTRRSNVAAFAVCFSHGFVFIAGSYFLPLYFQSVLGANPILSGVYLFPYVLSLSFLSGGVGIFIRKTGRYLEPIRFGMFMLTLGFGLFLDLQPWPSWARIVTYQIIAGIGVGPNFQSPLIALQTLVDPRDIATATATFGFVRQLSTAISVVLGGVIFSNGVDSRRHILTRRLPPDVAAAIFSSGTAPNTDALRSLPPAQKALANDVLTDSLRDMWILYVVMAAVGFVATFGIRRQVLSKRHETTRTGLDEEERKRRERLQESRARNGGDGGGTVVPAGPDRHDPEKGR